MTQLVLPEDLRVQIGREARAALPGECCGLIEGKRAQGMVVAMALHPARNIASGPDRFSISPEDHFAALKAARGNGHAVIGCYHSHPGGAAKPSAADAAGAGEIDFIWLIAAGRDDAWAFAACAYEGDGLFADLMISSV